MGSHWEDQGTAFCYGHFDESTNEAKLIARSETDLDNTILSTTIRSCDVYQRQQGRRFDLNRRATVSTDTGGRNPNRVDRTEWCRLCTQLPGGGRLCRSLEFHYGGSATHESNWQAWSIFCFTPRLTFECRGSWVRPNVRHWP